MFGGEAGILETSIEEGKYIWRARGMSALQLELFRRKYTDQKRKTT